MYVVIVGAGEVGSYVARILVEEGHDVAIVEADAERARRLDATLNALVVTGSGISPAALREAGVGEADLLLAVTAIDEVNLITCMTGRKHGSERLQAVARVRQSRHVLGDLALSAEDLGLDALVSPQHAMAEAAIHVLRYVGSGEMRELADGKLALVGMDLSPDSPLVHDDLASLREEFPGEFLVVAARGSQGLRIPKGGDRLQPQERAFVLTLPDNLMELAILSGRPWHPVRHVLIVGCGDTGLAAARRLVAQGFELTILERDADRAELVAGLLPQALVIHGDGSNPELLSSRIEEGAADTVLVFLEDPVRSVLIGIFASSLGAFKVIARCDEPGYVRLANRLGVDATLSPKRAMADAILRYLRADAVESTLLLGEHEAEVLRFHVPDRPRRRELTEKPLKELAFPEEALVGAVIRGDQARLASGDTVLRPGDELLVICRPEAIKKLEKLLS